MKWIKKFVSSFKEKEATNEQKIKTLLFAFEKITANDGPANKAEIFLKFKEDLKNNMLTNSKTYRNFASDNLRMSEQFEIASSKI